MRLPAAGLAAALVVWLLTPHIYSDFPGARVKVIRGSTPSQTTRLDVPIGVRPTLARLQTPFALIVRVRNESPVAATFTVELDGQTRCSAEIGAGQSTRIDCAVREHWIGDADHTGAIVSTGAPFSLEEFELASHHGATSPGPSDLIVVPEGSAAHRPASIWRLGVVFFLMWAAVLSVWRARPPLDSGERPLARGRPWLRRLHLFFAAVVGLVLLVTLIAEFVSPYGLVISGEFLTRLLVVAGLPVLWRWLRIVWSWVAAPRVVAYSRAVAIGLFVGWVFWSFAIHRADEWYRGNRTGLLNIGTKFYEQNPLVNERDDLRASLHLHDGGGYDGQFFYFAAFDPLITRYAHRPRSYTKVVDAPHYRFGRIGFSWLTWLFSGGNDTRFPATMIAIILGSLGICAALLSLLAQRYGLSSWYGALILFIPGFWQSAALTLPEPLTLAFVLGGLLAVARQRWVIAGLCLGMAMLVRETGGAIVLAIPAGIFLAGQRRAALVVFALAFTPVVLWKLYLGWIFYPVYGLQALTPHPDDVGLPFQGIWEMGTKIWSGAFVGQGEHVRSGILFAILSTGAAALAAVSFFVRPAAMTAAAAFYGLLTITFNYHAVWLNIGNAQRLSIDLFTALALAFVLTKTAKGWLLPRTFAIFWTLTVLYVLYGTYEAHDIRRAMLGWTGF